MTSRKRGHHGDPPPEHFGPWKTVHTRFSRWNKRGVFQQVLDEFKFEDMP
ncbi:MAG: transposase [Myxococcaceae bacterium]